jgi:hypothetical protein
LARLELDHFGAERTQKEAGKLATFVANLDDNDILQR